MATEPDTIDLSEYNGWQLVVAAPILLALSWIAAGLRGYVRIFMTKNFSLDDWLMLLGLALFTVLCTFVLLGWAGGLGHHYQALSQEKIVEALKWQILSSILYVVTAMTIKVSIGVFLLRLSIKRRFQYTIWATIVVVVFWSLGIFFWQIFRCSPVESLWDKWILDSYCTPMDTVVAAAYSFSVMSVLSDWLFALLPIPMLWGVNLSIQAKATVILVLGMGVFASVATLVRLAFLHQLGPYHDTIYDGTSSLVWTLVEPGVAIVAASMATIRPLLRRIGLPGFDSTERSGVSGGHHTSPRQANDNQLRTFRTFSYSSRRKTGPGDLTLIDLECGGSDEFSRRMRTDGGGSGGGGGKERAVDSMASVPDGDGHDGMRESYGNRTVVGVAVAE